MRHFLCVLTAFGLAACTQDSPQIGVSQHVENEGEIECTATFHWLQKDAYSETAGRTTPLWPAHTTTSIDVKCDLGFDTFESRNNHGTAPGARDAAGNVFLVEAKKSAPIKAGWKRINALLEAYKKCDCDASTQFLTVDLAQAEGKQLLTELGDYVANNMSCPGLDLDQIVESLASGRIDQVLAAISRCSWNDGASWSTGFDQATQAVLAERYPSFHVCNDDAQLQSALWEQFASGAEITACDSNADVCHGPSFFYNP